MDEQCQGQDMAENYQGVPSIRGRKTISIDRRKELVALAQEASDWIIQHNIKPEELCFFKQAVGMLTDIRA